MNVTVPITALAPWFGGKRNLAPRIVELLGPHRVYWELGCGSMAVLLAKPAAAMETAVDLHGDLVNLAEVVRDSALGPQLYRRLRRTLTCEAFFDEADQFMRVVEEETLPAKPGAKLERAYQYFVCSWMGRNGTAGLLATHKGPYCARYTAKGGHAATRWGSAIRSIPAWRQRLRRVTILQRDLFEILPRIEDAPETSIYVDPPYVKKGAKYLHDFTPADHTRLARELKRFRHARVVLSYYEHPRVRELYAGRSIEAIDVSKAMGNQGRRGESDARATELLITLGCTASPRTLWQEERHA